GRTLACPGPPRRPPARPSRRPTSEKGCDVRARAPAKWATHFAGARARTFGEPRRRLSRRTGAGYNNRRDTRTPPPGTGADMADDTTHPPALPSTADATPYAPISWMAVAAVGVAAVFVLILVVSGLDAWWNK